MRAPMPRSASTRSPIGRSCMRGTPERRYSPPENASAAVSGRKAVPGIAEEQLGLLDRERPADARHGVVHSNETPRRESASRMTRVSSASSRPSDLGLALGERGKEQHAVGDALRAGQPHRARGAARRLQLERIHFVARVARLGKELFQPGAVAVVDQLADLSRARWHTSCQAPPAADRGSQRRCRATSRGGSRRCA